MTDKEIKFGTDGWRGVISDDFTFDNVRIVSQAIADYLNKTNAGQENKIIVGYDTRFLSDKYAEITSEVLAANGIKVIISDGPCSTPSLSLVIKERNFAGGVMITASHNPPRYNGIKFKAHYAGPADPGVTKEIESLLYQTSVPKRSFQDLVKDGSITLENIMPGYEKFLKGYIDFKALKKAKFRILMDAMGGASNGSLARILKGTLCKVTALHQEPDPLFGGVNPEPIAKNLKEASAIIKKGRFDIGIASDGDGDRIGAIRPDGVFITPFELFALMFLHLIEDKKWDGSVVKTICGSYLIENIAKHYGIKLHETPVGFKYISSMMRKEDVIMGGEESGGFGFKNYTLERDGVLSGLLLLEMMAYRGKKISELIADVNKRFGPSEYMREDMECPQDVKERLLERLKSEPPATLAGRKVVEIKTYDGVKFIRDDQSWLLLRFSGTEPIIRIYAEARSKRHVKELLGFGKDAVLKTDK
ncbi:MAG: phosphoglucomutase/phosphomannomutase family protein [Candidatus Omnitrophica bacterium]|nr:phosphoglucomutase/phosphomannomutase family protein [Candidatus Omnitrophota bacterium]